MGWLRLVGVREGLGRNHPSISNIVRFFQLDWNGRVGQGRARAGQGIGYRGLTGWGTEESPFWLFSNGCGGIDVDSISRKSLPRP